MASLAFFDNEEISAMNSELRFGETFTLRRTPSVTRGGATRSLSRENNWKIN